MHLQVQQIKGSKSGKTAKFWVEASNSLNFKILYAHVHKKQTDTNTHQTPH